MAGAEVEFKSGRTTATVGVPIEKGVIHNQALPAANTDLFAAAISPTNTPTLFRVMVSVSIAGNFNATVTRGGNTQTITFNVIPGPALVADGIYIFDLLVHEGDTINYQYSATGGTIRVLRVMEVDVAVT